MRRVAILTSRREVDSPTALAAAHRVGRLLGENRLLGLLQGPVTGAAATVVNAALDAGGRIMIVSTDPPGEILGDCELTVVADDDAAQAELAARADAYLVLPGAVESLDGAFGVWAWSTDGSAKQPLALWDADSFFTDLLQEASDAALDRFARESQRGQLVIGRDPEELLRRLAEYRPPETRRNMVFDDE